MSRAVQHLHQPHMGPSSRGGECLSQRGDTRVLQLGSPRFGLLVWLFVPFELSEVPSHGEGSPWHLAASGTLKPACNGSVLWNLGLLLCCQAGMLDQTYQWGKQRQKSLFFLKQASNKEVFAPNISQLCKNPETYRFPKSFCSLSFSGSHMIP